MFKIETKPCGEELKGGDKVLMTCVGVGFSNLSKTLKWHCQKMKGPKASRQHRSCQGTKGIRFIQDFPNFLLENKSGYLNKRRLSTLWFSAISPGQTFLRRPSHNGSSLGLPRWRVCLWDTVVLLQHHSCVLALLPEPTSSGFHRMAIFQTFGVSYSSFCKDWPPWILVSV